MAGRSEKFMMQQMEQPELRERIQQLYEEDPCYGLDAYDFTIRAFRFTQTRCGRFELSSAELIEGVCLCAKRSFGPAAKRVLASWNVQGGRDIGELAFRLLTREFLDGTLAGEKEDFAAGALADFAGALAEPVFSRGLFCALCRLFFNPEQLDDLEQHFESGPLDVAWLEALELDPFILNQDPTPGQVGTFHRLLEETALATTHSRFDDALRAFEAFAREAAGWWPKPDLILYDYMTELEPYCPDFAAIVLMKMHLSPVPPVGYGWETQGVASTMEPIQVYLDRTWVDQFQAPSTASIAELEATALQCPQVRLRLRTRGIQRALIIQRNFQKNLHLTSTITLSP